MRRRTERYGPGEHRYGEWTLPDGAGPFPVLVLLHGGYWRGLRPYTRARGRRGAGPAGRGLDHLPASRFADRLDVDRVATVGHSAGGHLALWLAGRPALPSDAPGAVTADSVRLRLAVGQAPVADLVAGFRDGLGSGRSPEEVRGATGRHRRRRFPPLRAPGCCSCTAPRTSSCRCRRARATPGQPKRGRLPTYAWRWSRERGTSTTWTRLRRAGPGLGGPGGPLRAATVGGPTYRHREAAAPGQRCIPQV